MMQKCENISIHIFALRCLSSCVIEDKSWDRLQVKHDHKASQSGDMQHQCVKTGQIINKEAALKNKIFISAPAPSVPPPPPPAGGEFVVGEDEDEAEVFFSLTGNRKTTPPPPIAVRHKRSCSESSKNGTHREMHSN